LCSRAVGLWVEVDDDALPAEVGQLQRPPVLVGQLEVGGLVASLDHVSIVAARRGGERI